jgi:hypothetical protein
MCTRKGPAFDNKTTDSQLVAKPRIKDLFATQWEFKSIMGLPPALGMYPDNPSFKSIHLPAFIPTAIFFLVNQQIHFDIRDSLIQTVVVS